VIRALVVVAVLAVPARADKATAEAAFAQAMTLANEGKWAEACPLFLASYRADRQIGVLLHTADCHERTGRLATAWGEFREAEDLAAKSADARADIARDRAAALLPRLAKLVVTVPAVPGLVVLRGETDITQLLGTSAPVDPGEHVIVARAPGHRERRETVTVTGEATTATAALPPLEKLPEVPVTRAVTELDFGARNTRRGIAYRVAIPGAAATVLGLALAFKATRDYDRTRDDRQLCDAAFVCNADGRDAIAGARRTAIIGDIVTGVGVAALATGIVLFVTAPDAVAKDRVRVVPTGTGAALVGSF
jgi:hypothetical protein